MICSQCGAANREGELICQSCGTLLTEQVTAVRRLPQTNGLATRSATLTSDYCVLTLQVGEQVYELSTSGETSILLGRSDSALTPANLSILDLAEAGAESLGVSRRHALIRGDRGTFFVMDLDSTNGTFLNGRRLQPRNQHLLVSGDVLRLGALEVRVQIT